jgi:hypothetical protein
MEVGLAGERDRLPRLASVGRFDQPEQRRQALRLRLVEVRVPRAEEAVRADDREAHRVLVAVADALGLPFALVDAVEAGVGGDEERVVGRVHAETVHVHRPGVCGGSAGERLVVVIRREPQDRPGGDQADERQRPEDEEAA